MDPLFKATERCEAGVCNGVNGSFSSQALAEAAELSNGHTMHRAVFGLGLLSIGRVWGVKDVAPPPESEARILIQTAFDNGIRFFDTAPAYGISEEILGRQLRTMPIVRPTLTIATKVGEHWLAETRTTRVSHTYSEMQRSIETSLQRLGTIDILQIHKATRENLLASDTIKAIEFAKASGIRKFGASISDYESGQAAIESGMYASVQFPYNRLVRHLGRLFPLAAKYGVSVIVNRPLAMGELIGASNSLSAIKDAFRFILETDFDGVVLTGTSSTEHLLENSYAFAHVRSR
jgi:aryl-alcohol dehydrogenase-like predicted oxidoreductase